MTLAIAFWVTFLIVVVLGFYRNRADAWGYVGGSFPVLILIFLLGWATFGFIIQGGGPR